MIAFLQGPELFIVLGVLVLADAAGVLAATNEEPLVIPEGAVVVAGSRAVTSGKGKEWGISLYTPVIVKYRDAKTDAKIQLEDLLR